MVGVSSREGKNPNQAAVSFRVGMMMIVLPSKMSKNAQRHGTTNNKPLGCGAYPKRRSCHRDNHSKPVNFTVAYFQRNSLRETLLSCCSYSRIATRLQCRPHVAVLQCERDDGSKTSETDVAMNSSDLENDFIGKSLSITGWWF
jgi:hypothetical protein